MEKEMQKNIKLFNLSLVKLNFRRLKLNFR